MKHVDLTVGGIEATGDYRYEIGALRPHRFQLKVVSANAADLENHAAARFEAGQHFDLRVQFRLCGTAAGLAGRYACGRRDSGRIIDGGRNANLQFAKQRCLGRHGGQLHRIGSWVEWPIRRFSPVPQKVHLAARQPRYEVTGNLSGFAWQGGPLTAIGGFHTFGTGTDLLANLRAEGTFTGKKLEVATFNPWDSVEGKFDFSIVSATPRLHLSGLTVQSAGTKWTGAADTQDSGQTVFRLADGPRHLEASGALLKGEALRPLP